VRATLAVLSGAVVATAGGFILGEYPFTGVTGAIAGALLGLFVAEAVVFVGRRRDWLTLAASVVLGVAGTALAVGISTHNDRGKALPAGAWAAMVLAALVAAYRSRPAAR
jgi:drug/metabolite transporter (DMT)-like permease